MDIETIPSQNQTRAIKLSLDGPREDQPIYIAAENGYEEMVKLLLTVPSQVRHDRLRLALDSAISNAFDNKMGNYTRICKHIVDLGILVHRDYVSSVCTAFFNLDEEILLLLINEVDINSNDPTAADTWLWRWMELIMKNRVREIEVALRYGLLSPNDMIIYHAIGSGLDILDLILSDSRTDLSKISFEVLEQAIVYDNIIAFDMLLSRKDVRSSLDIERLKESGHIERSIHGDSILELLEAVDEGYF
ncbi:Hypothetical protein POVR2_LOCUS72 [uncultured virus]|nr:Hypothetical protein POVR2_LOCUS72 [uncultured virus]